MLFRATAENYTTIPTRTAAGTVSLIRALAVAAAPKPPAKIKARLAAMLLAGTTLQATWIDVNRPGEPSLDLRPHDLRLDKVWRKVHNRIADWADLGHSDKAERATELMALLFPTGLDFLTFKYNEQWSESQRRLDLIAADGLAPDLADLVGSSFMSELDAAHTNYGEVLGITTKREPSPDPARVVDALRAARQAMTAYARLVFAYADPDDADEVAAAEAALEPILRFRVPRVMRAAEDEPIEDPLPTLAEAEVALADASGE